MNTVQISLPDALALIERDESPFWDQKSLRSGGAVIQKIAVALANTDGGEFIVGIEDQASGSGISLWSGFPNIEESNFIHQSLTSDIRPPVQYSYEYYLVEGHEGQGLACMVRVEKSGDVHYTAANKVYVRRGASSTEISGQQIVDLQLAKGSMSYEDQSLADYSVAELSTEPELQVFLSTYSPHVNPTDFARRERIGDQQTGQAKVSAALLFSEYPSSVVPKRCAIKISRYETAGEPRREHLAFPPITVDGPLRTLVESALERTTSIVESVSVLEPDGSLVPMKYPPEALKELVVNAVIHRDYNLSDDVHISIFDNRVEVRSLGGLAGQMTLELLFTERTSRNPKVLRLLNRYPNPLNQDIGEGLTTARDKMMAARLKAPRYKVEGNYFIATLPHERLARPEELIMEYLAAHEEITNRTARELTGIQSENTVKEVFYALRNVGKIERVPGRNGNRAAWQKV
ncbi:ATP-binding protein [Conyzicola sp.]|uniref:ATP-binding protein n=1 Tax=Conyzicola sp. TaxID=1969404 RepID=UPI003988DA40